LYKIQFKHMRKNSFMLLVSVLFTSNIFSQSLSVNTDGSIADASAMLDVKSTSKGMLVPRMTKAERNSIATPANGLMVYQTAPDSTGFYYYDATVWRWVANANQPISWLITGNAATDTSVNFIGTVDNMPLRIKQNNTWLGQLNLNNAAYYIGKDAGRNSASTTSNIGIGTNALTSNSLHSYNIAIGDSTLSQLNGATGSSITHNVVIGHKALMSLNPTTTVQGNFNTVVGDSAGYRVTTAYQNVLIGGIAGKNLTTGFNNIYIGYNSAAGGGGGGQQNTVIGQAASTSSSVNGATLIGQGTSAGASVTNGTAIGQTATVTQSNSMVFGNTLVTKWGFGTNTVAANILEFNPTVTTAVLTTGGAWTNASDRAVKQNISVLDSKDVLSRVMQLPVTRWSYIKEGNSITHIGPMAQDFYKLFGTGQNDKTISTIDPSGVALIAIQELKKENEELKKRIIEQENANKKVLDILKQKGLL
jgi:hypothetical protein